MVTKSKTKSITGSINLSLQLISIVMVLVLSPCTSKAPEQKTGRTIENFKVFDNFFIMTGGGPGVATETISIYIYKVTQQDLIWGYVAAIALAILIVLSIVSGLAISKMRNG